MLHKSHSKHWMNKHWTIALRGNSGLGACKHLATSPSTYQYITFIWWVFLFQDTLFNRYCWFINMVLRANSPVTPAWMELTSHTYFLRRIVAILHWGTLDGAFKQQINKKQGSVRNVSLNRLWKGHLFTGGELQQEGDTLPPSASAGGMRGQLRFSTALQGSTNGRERTAGYWFWACR